MEDAGLEDAGLEDAGLDDTSLDDAGLEDAGLEDAGLEEDCLEEDVLEAGLEVDLEDGFEDDLEDGLEDDSEVGFEADFEDGLEDSFEDSLDTDSVPDLEDGFDDDFLFDSAPGLLEDVLGVVFVVDVPFVLGALSADKPPLEPDFDCFSEFEFTSFLELPAFELLSELVFDGFPELDLAEDFSAFEDFLESASGEGLGEDFDDLLELSLAGFSESLFGDFLDSSFFGSALVSFSFAAESVFAFGFHSQAAPPPDRLQRFNSSSDGFSPLPSL